MVDEKQDIFDKSFIAIEDSILETDGQETDGQ